MFFKKLFAPLAFIVSLFFDLPFDDQVELVVKVVAGIGTLYLTWRGSRAYKAKEDRERAQAEEIRHRMRLAQEESDQRMAQIMEQNLKIYKKLKESDNE